IPSKKCRKFFVSYTFHWKTLQQSGCDSTIPTREFAKPLSIARSIGTPRPKSFSLNQTETPFDSSKSCSSFAAPFLSSHAWQRKTSRRSGLLAKLSTLLRTGVSARICLGVYVIDDQALDHLGFDLLVELLSLLLVLLD